MMLLNRNFLRAKVVKKTLSLRIVMENGIEIVATICGNVQHGRKLGRSLGFPTANVEIGGENRATDGVYLAQVAVDDTPLETHWALVNIGRRPSVETSGARRNAEAWIFDFDRDIYQHSIEIRLVKRLRDELRFDSLDALRAAMEQDKINAIKIIEEYEHRL